MNKKIERLIDTINDEGIDSVIETFDNNVDALLNFFQFHNSIDEIDIDWFDSEHKNKIYLFLIDNGQKTKVVKDIINGLGSVSFDGTDYFYELRNLTELVEYFKGYNRDTSPYDIAQGVLSEDYWEPFDVSRRYTDLMTDVYDDLIPENKKYLRDYVVEKYKNDLIVVSSDEVTDVIDRIGTENEDGDYEFHIKNENVMDLFSDDTTMNYLFENDLVDVGDNLMDVYRNSYNGAYEIENYDKVWDGLKDLVIDADAKIIDFQYNNKNWVKLKITNTLPYLISEYLSSDNCTDIDSLGDYRYLINEGISCGAWESIGFTISNYPDSDIVKKMINEILKDYI